MATGNGNDSEMVSTKIVMKQNSFFARFLQILLGLIICFPALLMPYKARAFYFDCIAFLVHLPYFVIGRLVTQLCQKLNIEFDMDPDDV